MTEQTGLQLSVDCRIVMPWKQLCTVHDLQQPSVLAVHAMVLHKADTRQLQGKFVARQRARSPCGIAKAAETGACLPDFVTQMG